MSDISDELRELADEAGIYSNARTKLCELADRIDREMLELPRDKDGVPIHVGDTVYMEDGIHTIVHSIDLMADATNIVCWVRNRGYVPLNPSDVTHTLPDSFERIADELKEWSKNPRGLGGSKLYEWADRIRKLAEKEASDGD